MNCAILHDYFDEIGGAEITLLILARELDATIFTTNIDHKKINELGYSEVDIVSIGTVPRRAPWKQYVARYRFWRLRLHNISTYIFGGSCALYAAQKHAYNVWYVSAFPVGLHDKARNKGYVTWLWKFLDNIFVQRIHTVIANSRSTRDKVRQYYDRDTVPVVYHPINTSSYVYKPHADYWLSVNRIDTYKNIELQLEVFSGLPDEKLVIVGEPTEGLERYYTQLKEQAPGNVSFIGGVYDRKKMIDLYAECKGFIATAHEEDFGMTVVEAMASGKSVVAMKKGGYLESIVDGETGKLVVSNADELIEAVRSVGNETERYKNACQKRAYVFDTEVFLREIKKYIQ